MNLLLMSSAVFVFGVLAVIGGCVTNLICKVYGIEEEIIDDEE